MSGKNIESDLKRLDGMSDEDIDYSEIPELDDEFFAKAKKLSKGTLGRPLEENS